MTFAVHCLDTHFNCVQTGNVSFTTWPEVSFLWSWLTGLCDLQPESIILREFKVSGYMACALGRVERCRGKWNPVWFLYNIDHHIQSFKLAQVSPDVRSCSARPKSFDHKHKIKHRDRLIHHSWRETVASFAAKYVDIHFPSLSLWNCKVHRLLCGCCCHLLMSPVMMWDTTEPGLNHFNLSKTKCDSDNCEPAKREKWRHFRLQIISLTPLRWWKT